MIELEAVPQTIPIGTPTEVAVRITNGSAEACTNVRVDLELPRGLELRQGLRELRRRSLDAGSPHDEWLVVRAAEPGDYTIQVRNLSYRDPTGCPVRRKGATISIRAEIRRPGWHGQPGPGDPPPRWCDCGSIFINYRRVDTRPLAARLARDLPVRTGHRVFHDHSSLRGGEDFRERLSAEVGESVVLLALVGPRWLTATASDGGPRLHEDDDLVRIEIRSALRQGHTTVIPVLVNGAQAPGSALPSDIQDLFARQAVTYRSPADLVRVVTEVLRACRRLR